MFALQLLRILQIMPADVNHETWDFDAPEVNFTMKENQNRMLHHSNSFEREADPFIFGLQDEPNSWNASKHDCSEVVDRRTDRDDSEARDSRMLEDQEGPLCHSNGCKGELESSDGNNELWISPEFERSIIEDSLSDSDENESGDSRALLTSVSKLVGSDSDADFYTDKDVRECELSEVIVCYKQSNCHIVKDICVDEGLPTQDKTLIETDRDGHADLFVSQPGGEDKHSEKIEECQDIEYNPDGPKVSTIEDITQSSSSNSETEEEANIGPFPLDRSKSYSEDYAGKDDTNVLGPQNLTQMDETNCCELESTAANVLEDKTAAIKSRHSSQDSIVQDSLLHTSNRDGNEAPKPLDEVPSVEAILESLAVAFTTEDSKKNGTANHLRYNSKVESGAITFDFKSSKAAVGSGADGSAENSHEECLKAEDVPNHSAATFVESSSEVDKNEHIHEPKTQSHDATDHSSQVQRGAGESSFSSSGPVSGIITYSGPMVYSGSTSLRSDSSATSTRSFAFPILQSEWNSSPVRMTKPDRRHFRKHRNWREGLFCCRF